RNHRGCTMRKLKPKPKFKSDAQESAFWASHDSTEYIDYSKSRRMVFPKLKPSTETISLRLPKSLLEQLKTLANKRDVPYQTLLKLFLLERVQAELHLKTAKAS
ncbi:MAG: BrnA antitoxin family protein, partial [Nitrospira sp.]|nr:BrnA antitoxin family protein [Nitrospira sp.]